MVRSRRSRSRRAALGAARRSLAGAGWRSGGRGGSGGDGLGRSIVLLLIALGLIGVGFALGRWSANRGTAAPQARAAALHAGPESVEATESAQSVAAAAPDLPAADRQPEPAPPEPLAPASPGASPIAIVIDDLGRSLGVIDELRGFGIPLTYAVLPFEIKTAEVAARLAELGEEVLCHLPMEAQRGENPGPGALSEAMDEDEIRDATRHALEAVPGAVGVNNHMGSALSADRAAMGAVLDVVREHDLFFLDSRTSAASVAYTLARESGIPAAERKVFLDRDRAPEAIRHEFRRLLALANRGEPAIAIGHPSADTLAVLAEEIPRAREQGYRFVRVSDVVGGKGEVTAPAH